MSSSVFSGPREMRSVQTASSSERPMAVRTCESFVTLASHAAPAETAAAPADAEAEKGGDAK